MAVAVFDYAAWSAIFPGLVAGGVTEPVAQSLFTIAGYLFDNTDCSPVQDIPTRLTFLNYVVAHLASLSGYPLAAGVTVPVPSGMIGYVTSATEGTVSVSSGWGASVSDSEAFWLQSQYGAIFWQMTRGLRTMRYVPAHPRNFGPGFGYRGFR